MVTYVSYAHEPVKGFACCAAETQIRNMPSDKIVREGWMPLTSDELEELCRLDTVFDLT